MCNLPFYVPIFAIRCIKHRLLHGTRKIDASNTVCCMELEKSMHQTPSAAWNSKNRCIKHRLLHGTRKIDASNAVCCIELEKSMHQAPSAAWNLKNRCIKHRLLHGT